MARISIIFGVLLILLGVGSYFGTGVPSVTALIPAAFGVVLAVLGRVAFRESARKHAMHAASVVGLLGVVGALARPVKAALGGEFAMSAAAVSQLLMALLCAVFLGLCVKSFVDARRRA